MPSRSPATLPANIQKLDSLLLADPALRPFLDQAQALAKAQQVYADISPLRLARYSRVIALQGTTLVLAADNGAIGAKLKLLAPSWIGEFRLRGQEVNAIRVEVQASPRADQGLVRASAKPLLPESAVTSLRKLEQSLPASPLRDAITRLLTRHSNQ